MNKKNNNTNKQQLNMLSTKQVKRGKRKVKKPNQNFAYSQSQAVGNAIKRTINKAQNYYEVARERFEPFSKYVHMLLHENSPAVITPLNPLRVFAKRARYQDTIQVNSSGAALIALQPAALYRFGSTSTSSPVLYVNETSYNPDSTTNALTGGWNTNIVGTSGTNISTLAVNRSRVASMHVTFEITGVSNLNKSGTIHLAEHISPTYLYGTSTDTTSSEKLANNCAISALPKFAKYKSVEIVNMGSDSVLEYHYVPVTNMDMVAQFGQPTNMTTASGDTQYFSDMGKNFCLVVKGAHPDTIIRARYEINLEFQVFNDYVNDYPPNYSRCFVQSEPTLQLINQHEDYIIRVNAKQGHVDKTLYQDVQLANALSATEKLSLPHLTSNGIVDVNLKDNVNLFTK
jgi:hypothetical protein